MCRLLLYLLVTVLSGAASSTLAAVMILKNAFEA